MRILILNGPNLNLTGKRQPEIYGSVTFEDLLAELKKDYPDVALDLKQSNIEGELVDMLHHAEDNYDGIILNAGAYTHTSAALGDAIGSLTVPVVEVHISNIYSRESFRHVSFTAAHCRGVIAGFGLMSYRLAVESFLQEKKG